mmetsp:Transcript_8562/g.15175  ORF Transcript_8562/g.15175 Transcript_8562/m.15175 type:complete len:131 (-) Transcript_8562:1102-1494(-)
MLMENHRISMLSQGLRKSLKVAVVVDEEMTIQIAELMVLRCVRTTEWTAALVETVASSHMATMILLRKRKDWSVKGRGEKLKMSAETETETEIGIEIEIDAVIVGREVGTESEVEMEVEIEETGGNGKER